MGHPVWPLFDLEVSTPRLRIRYVDDDLAVQLAELAARGIHDPSWMPFTVPWTDTRPPRLQQEALRYYWRCRADTSSESFDLPLAVLVDDVVVGASGIRTEHFPALRQFLTGSWLGLEHQGRGLGRELRIATLTIGFDALLAELATTAAFEDNHPSLGVTRSLGYTAAGRTRVLRRDGAGEQLTFRMDRAHFDTIRRPDVEVTGGAAVRELLGIDDAPLSGGG